MLRKYKQVLPELPERVLAMAESRQEHRHHIERVAVEGDSRRATLGLVLGFVIAVGFLIAAVVLVLNGYQAAGIAFGTIDLVGLTAVFVYGSRSRRQERREKADLMARAQAAMNPLAGMSPASSDDAD